MWRPLLATTDRDDIATKLAGAAMASDIGKRLSLNHLILALSAIQLGWLLWYFYTGSGGPQELVAHLLPITIVLQFCSWSGWAISIPSCRRA